MLRVPAPFDRLAPKHGLGRGLRNRSGRSRARAARRPELEPLDSRVLLSGVPTPDHVVVVIDENHAFSQIIGSPNAPYINSLVQKGALFTNASAETHPSLPNYLNLFSGSTQGVTDDTNPAQPLTTPNLGAELIATGHTFASYAEDLPSAGSTVISSGAYVRRHNPSIDWQGASANAIPASDNLPFTSFPTDFSTLPTVSFVIPNLNDDMHDGTVQAGDTWLQNNLSSYIQWAPTHNSLFILTFDENDGSAGNQIPTLFLGASVLPGSYSEPINHFSLLRTVEDMYGLPLAGSSATANPITDVWRTAGATQTAVTASAGTPFSGTVAAFSSADTTATPGTFTASINWGDGHTTTGVIQGTPSSGFTVQGSNTYTSAGTFPIRVTVTSLAGDTLVVNNTAQVSRANALPVLVAIPQFTAATPTPVNLGQPVTLVSAVVSPFSSVGIPTGSVVFLDVLNGHVTTLGTVPLNGAGIAVFPAITSLQQGINVIVGVYTGDANYAPLVLANPPVIEVVNPGVTPGQVTVTQGSIRRAGSGAFREQVIVQNIGTAAVNGPIFLVLDDLTPGATLLNPSGTAANGSPFVLVTPGNLGARMRQVVSLTFRAGSNHIVFSPRVVTGISTL